MTLPDSVQAGDLGHVDAHNAIKDLLDLTPSRLGGTASTAARFPFLNVQDFGAVGDQHQPGTTITLTSGDPVGVMAVGVSVPPTVGQTLVTETAGNYLITGVSGTNITVSPPPAVSGSMKFHYGTDNTAAFNAFIAQCVSSRLSGVVPGGRYLITDTIGILEGASTFGKMGLSILWSGGGGNYVGRLSNMSHFLGCALVWGGSTGGTMMQMSRALYTQFLGSIVFVGQQSYDVASVNTRWGPKSGLGFHMSQELTPEVGTGYLNAETLVFDGGANAMQFGTNLLDNNCDTTIINRLVLWHCDNGVRVKNTQGLSYRIGWMQAASVPGYCIKTDDGGAFDLGSVHLNNCGTATADPTADTYSLDFASSINGYTFKIGLLRVESGCKRVLATRSDTISVKIDLFSETNTTNVDDALFLLAGGRVRIGGGYLNSHKVAGRCPIYLRRSANGRQPRIALEEMHLPTAEWAYLFDYADAGAPETAVIADISVEKCRDQNYAVISERHSRAERGRVVHGDVTLDATTSVRLDPKFGLGPDAVVEAFSQGIRVPLGMAEYEVSILADHLDGTSSFFRRQVQTRRSGDGTSAVVSVQTLGSDRIVGTDQIVGFNLGVGTASTLSVNVQGTAATSERWRATWTLLSQYSGNPDS